MANREQKSNREKKKPKSDKKAAPIMAQAKPGFRVTPRAAAVYKPFAFYEET